jgi:hypothetical protein
MCSEITVNRILDGKQYYRALETHTVTVLALLEVNFNRKMSIMPEAEKQKICDSMSTIKSTISNISSSCDTSQQNIDSLLEIGESVFGIVEDFFCLSEVATKTEQFIASYVKQFMTILTFIRATRDNNIMMHLEATRALLKYFFANNNLSYARLQSLYLTTMEELKTTNPEIWNEFLNGNLFSVSKNGGSFRSIAPDHAHEQEIKIIKGNGGVIGITQKEECLDRYFKIAHEMLNINKKFESEFLIKNHIRTEHHEKSYNIANRMETCKNKLVAVFEEYSIFSCCEATELTNFFTLEKIDPVIVADIVNRDQIGEELAAQFIEDRLINEKKTIWDPMSKSKIHSFTSELPTKTKKAPQTKSEKNLMQRLIVAAQSRPEINLKESLPVYEFGNVPRSLFSEEGKLLLAQDKSSILKLLEKKMKNENAADIGNNEELLLEKTIIIDGMAYVHCMQKTKATKTCVDFAQNFISMLERRTSDYKVVYLVFDK